MDQATGLADTACRIAERFIGDVDELATAVGLLDEAERAAAGDQELLAWAAGVRAGVWAAWARVAGPDSKSTAWENAVSARRAALAGTPEDSPAAPLKITLKNYTPHHLRFQHGGQVIELPSQGTARCRERVKSKGNWDAAGDVPRVSVGYGEVSGLPEPHDGVVYLVSQLVVQSLPGRSDLAYPHELHRIPRAPSPASPLSPCQNGGRHTWPATSYRRGRPQHDAGKSDRHFIYLTA